MITYQVFLTPDAIDDLKSIYGYIAENSGYPETAYRYIQKLKEKCENLKTAPLRGQRRDDIRPLLRILPIDKNAVIAFEVNEDKQTVTVFNVFYGGQDYETLMKDNSELFS